MPYAGSGELGTGQISTAPFPGAIEITQQQYEDAVQGMMQGKMVSIEGGFSVEFPPVPEPPIIEPPTPEETRARVLAERDQKLVQATTRMAPLQDAVELGESTSAEEAALLSWKRYRVALNRIELQPGFPDRIDWPVAPDATAA